MILSRLLVLSLLGSLLAACDDSSPGGADAGTPGPDASSSACTGTGMGTLVLTVAGLPAGAAARVTLSAPGGATSMVTMTETRLTAGGTYGVTADLVTVPGALVRTAYSATVSTASPCVRDGQTTTITVTYALIASSGKVWTGNGNMLGYAPAALAASGSPAATVAARTNGSDGFAFDRNGNLWVLGATTADPPLARFAAGSLGSSGNKTPDVIISSPSFGGGSPGPKVAAFDRMGNLWVSVVWARKVVRFTPAQIAATGMPNPAVEIGNIEGPSGIAFDMTGNMYLASGKGVVLRIDAARLSASGMGGDLEISAIRPPPVIGALPDPEGLAFDKDGYLWANFGGTLVRLAPADLQGTGTKMITPAIQITTEVQSLPHGIAFDEMGGLWLAYRMGQLVRLGSTQLTSSGAKTPEVVIAGADIGYADWFALYPAPAALPLYHALP